LRHIYKEREHPGQPKLLREQQPRQYDSDDKPNPLHPYRLKKTPEDSSNGLGF
jgi:hypothetical protein